MEQTQKMKEVLINTVNGTENNLKIILDQIIRIKKEQVINQKRKLEDLNNKLNDLYNNSS